MSLKNSPLVTMFTIVIFCHLVSIPLTEANAGTPGLLPVPAHKTTAGKDLSPENSPGSEVWPTATAETSNGPGTSFFFKNSLADLQLFLEDFTLRAYWRLNVLDINKNRLLYDLQLALKSLATLSGFSNIFELLAFLAVVFLIAAVVEWLIRSIVLQKYLKQSTKKPTTWQHRFRLSLARLVPELVSLTIFSVASYISYIIVYSTFFSIICPFYLSTLVTIIIIRFFTIFFALPLSPYNENLRLISWDNPTAQKVYRSATLFISTLTIGITATSLLKYGGLKGDSLVWITLFFGTTIIITTGIVVFLNRKTIANWVAGNFASHRDNQESGQSFSYTWISVFVFYLALLWIIWVGKLILSESQFTLAFSISLLIIPLFLVMDSLIGWLFSFVGKVLSGDDTDAHNKEQVFTVPPEPNVISIYLRTLSRLMLIGILLLWTLSLWNIRLSYTTTIVSGMRKVSVLFIIFFFLWQIIDKSIGTFLDQNGASQEEEEDSGEGEWGDGPLLDRSQTLLPIVRKFLGIVMVVMLTLFTLSSLGINIGPLLAGAGVMGIAIGFGAQKLVSDLLSGFFYLVDDAFRVGEYIEAGSITGTVEKITLRNLMLRHHRGMLQIVPYSDLGAITNYMRGGIVVKFNLQFPYDTDVDLVRKVVKRVGIEMLEDPEFGNNFIKQLKSQGIREVGDSVLTIRVKFTAKPGTHFVIRREAYRRITEALNAKGIYYAHRKVIVDFPESKRQEINDPEVREKLLEAGAASTLAANGGNQEQTGRTA